MSLQSPPESNELVGTFQSEVFRNSKDWTVNILRGGIKATGCSGAGQLKPGIEYLFSGKWSSHPQYGQQFKFEAFTQKTPHTREAVIAYLKHFATGIGDKTAHAIVDCFGAEKAIYFLKNHPIKVANSIPRINLAAAQTIAKELLENESYQSIRIDLMGMLTGSGLQVDKCIEEAIRQWGAEAPKLIRENPWLLLRNKYPGAGFSRCDKLHTKFGHPPDCDNRQTAAAWHVLNSDRSGSTWFLRKDAAARIDQLIGVGSNPNKAIDMAIEHRVIETEVFDGEPWLAEARNARSERSVNDRLEHLA